MATTTIPAIPTSFGSGGSGLVPKGRAPSLVTILTAIRDDIVAALLRETAAPQFNARGVTFANHSLTAFTVATNTDGITYVAGDVVLLANQTTPAENGLYVVGTVATTAPLTRIAGLPTGATYRNGCTVEVSEGTIYAGSSWKAMGTGALVVGTDNPAFYPRVCKAKITLASGTKTLGATEGLYLFSVAKSVVQLTRRDAGGTVTSTIMYASADGTRVAGVSGTGAIVVQAVVAAGTINAADNSVVDVLVTNW